MALNKKGKNYSKVAIVPTRKLEYPLMIADFKTIGPFSSFVYCESVFYQLMGKPGSLRGNLMVGN